MQFYFPNVLCIERWGKCELLALCLQSLFPAGFGQHDKTEITIICQSAVRVLDYCDKPRLAIVAIVAVVFYRLCCCFGDVLAIMSARSAEFVDRM